MQEDCIECKKIRCRECGWKANSDEVLLIQQQKLNSCPVCGWSPRV